MVTHHPPLSPATWAENMALLSLSVFRIKHMIQPAFPQSSAQEIPPPWPCTKPFSLKEAEAKPQMEPPLMHKRLPHWVSSGYSPWGVPTGNVCITTDPRGLRTLTVDIAWWGPGQWCPVEGLECTGSFYSTVLHCCCCCCLCWGWEEPWGGGLVHRTAANRKREVLLGKQRQYLLIDQPHLLMAVEAPCPL